MAGELFDINGDGRLDAVIYKQAYPSIDADLMNQAGILNYEKVHVLNITNGSRLETYAIPSEQKGKICINGAAAHLMHPGELIIIISYVQIDVDAAKKYTPKIICVDKKNQIKVEHEHQ